MKHRTYINVFLLAIGGLCGALFAGCGDSVEPDEGQPGVIRVFGEVDLPDGNRLRFRIDLDREGDDYAFAYVEGEGAGAILPGEGPYRIEGFDLDDDSLHFELAGTGRSVSFAAWNSFPIFIGEAWPEGERADSLFSWDGGGCTSEAPADGGVFTDPDVDIGYPVRYELPAYPDSLIDAGVHGSVRVQVRVGYCGTPIKETLSRSVHEALDQLVMDAVAEWDFYPGRFSYTYVTIDQYISVAFEIDELGRGSTSLQIGI